MGHEEALPVEVACTAAAALWVDRLSQVLSLFLALPCVSGEGSPKRRVAGSARRGEVRRRGGARRCFLAFRQRQQQKSPEGCGGGSADGCRRCDSGTQ